MLQLKLGIKAILLTATICFMMTLGGFAQVVPQDGLVVIGTDSTYFLPPVGPSVNAKNLDLMTTLSDVLILDVTFGTKTERTHLAFDSTSDFRINKGSYMVILKDVIIRQGDQVRIDLSVKARSVGELRAMPLHIGRVNYSASETVMGQPIKFYVENNAKIRAWQLAYHGSTGTEIVKVLKEEYACSSEEIANSLMQLRFTPEEMATAMKENGYDAAVVAHELVSVYRLQATAVVAILDDEYELSSDDTAKILKTENFTQNEMAQALFNNGYSATAVNYALKGVYFVEYEVAGSILKVVGFDANNIAEALTVVNGIGAKVLFNYLEGLEFQLDLCVRATKLALNVTSEVMAAILMEDGKAVDVVVGLLHGEFKESFEGTVSIVWNIMEKTALNQKLLAETTLDLYDLGQDYAMSVLDDYAFKLEILGDAFKLTYLMDNQTLFGFLDTYYDVTGVLSYMRTYAGLGINDAAKYMKALNYSMETISSDLGTLYGAGSSTVVDALKYAGYGTGEIESTLSGFFSDIDWDGPDWPDWP